MSARSNRKKPRDAYHHGDLKRELVGKAIELLRDVSIEAISLRGLASALGVSHNAPYMHFKSRDALLAAIAEEGFRRLSGEFRTVGDLCMSRERWIDDFSTGCRVYIGFAEGNPELFRVMFLEHDRKAFPDYLDESMSALQFLSVGLERGQEFGLVKDGRTESLTNFVWSLLHGIAVLHAGRRNERKTNGRRNREQLIDDCLQYALSGIRTSEKMTFD